MSVNSMLHQKATIYTRTGYDKFGRDTSSGGNVVFCRFQNDVKTIIQPNQQVVVQAAVIYFAGDASVNIEDRVVVAGLSYKVFEVNGSVDGRGNQRIIKARVTKWQT